MILLRYFPSMILILAGMVSLNFSTDSTANWAGDYHYEETPVKAEAGYYMSMVWHLSVLKDGSGMLEINGQQTFIQLKTKIRGTGDEIAVIYDQLLDGDAGTLKKGDTLFVLKRLTKGLSTHWHRMKPRLNENLPLVGLCFYLKK